jgi:hypothetical protein
MHLSHSVYRTCCGGVLLALLFSLDMPGQSAQSAQTSGAPPASPDAQRCTALTNVDFGGLPDALTRIVSARLVDVSPPDPQGPPGVLAASPIKQYCQVQGYVAPQNKFELRLPLPAEWNHRFHLTPCAGFCGAVNGNACNASPLPLYLPPAAATTSAFVSGRSGFGGCAGSQVS